VSQTRPQRQDSAMQPPYHKFTINTERLVIRPFKLDDLNAIQRIRNEGFGEEPPESHRQWLEWQIRNYDALANLYQPPYGDYAVDLKVDSKLIGSVGVVPSFGPYDTLPYFQNLLAGEPSKLMRPEMGLYWVLDAARRRQGFATEAVRALTEHLFKWWNVRRLIATTEYENEASIAVMKRVGMTIERNPHDDPPWFQIVGILENPALGSP
jgi:ribosomal-protein-alanine N-acetyltransferase